MGTNSLCRVRMVYGTNGLGYEWSRVRMVYGTNSPGYERSRVRIVQGTNSLETQTYLPTKWHLDPSSRLVTAYMGQKLGVVPLGVAGSSSNKCGQSRGLPPYQVAC